MRVTFLEATNGLRLSKQHSSIKGFTPYPLVKAVKSTKHDLVVGKQGLNDLEQLIRQYASAGQCMLKGNLKRDLIDESRAGHSDKSALSNLLVLDVDGVTLTKSLLTKSKLSSIDVMMIADQIIAELPVELHDVSYIAQASSSLGLKGEKVSLHIFMMLSIAMPPKSIKLWLQDLNYESDLFSSQLELSVNGQSLKFPMDTSVADNSKVIFIAPPTFDDPNDNPFTTDDDRIVKVDRGQPSFDLAQLMTDISPQRCYEKSITFKDKLRANAGFKTRQTKTRLASIQGITEEVLLNPDKMSIAAVDDTNFPYIRCNMNGGDSGAYYFNAERPTYMYNFKDEPIFEIEKADKDFYMSVFEMYEEKLKETGKSQFPIVMRDYYTDTFYNGVYDPNSNQFTEEYPLLPIGKQNVEDFYLSHSRIAPDFIPDGRVEFNPTSDEPSVNFSKVPYYVNTYRKTVYALNPIAPDVPLEVGTSILLKDQCPIIYKVMSHMLGNGNQEFERFINWLAHIYQTRKKTGVSWVLTGTQGTGKGIFYSRILKGLFGSQHVPMRYLQSMEEQFNLYMRDALFLVVDEFHMASASTGASKMADKLKNQITENTITIRGMRSNQTEIPNYTNYIFNTNRSDAVNIEPGDRRYNIGPKQEQKLLDAYPELAEKLDTKELETELYKLAGALSTYKVNKRLVETPIDNTAKENMRTVSMSVFDEFCMCLKEGNLQFFTDILDINTASVLHSNEITAAQRLVKGWISKAKNPYAVIPMEHLRTVFHVQTEQTPRLSQQEFKKRMSRNNIEAKRKREYSANRDSNAVRGVIVEWDAVNNDVDFLITTYFDDTDQRLLATA